MKNQLLALNGFRDRESQDFYKEVTELIQNYDQVMNLEDEVLSTLLTQKRYYCQKQGINFTYMTDETTLNFMKKIDLYTVLGNALDNAIECVEKYKEVRYRQVSLHISTYKGFVRVQVVNPFLEDLEWNKETFLPQTSKKDEHFHGFGLRSIQQTLNKYDGWLSIQTDNQLFTLNMMVPFPQEEIG